MSFEQWLQSNLTSHGFPCGIIDGIIGPITLEALRAFQREKGLNVTGKADQDTVEALRDLPDPEPLGREAVAHYHEWPRQRDVREFFGEPGTNQTHVHLPFPMKLAWNLTYEVKRITLHEKVAESAARCFERIANEYDESARIRCGLDIFGGSLNVRKMRGGNAWSMHSWGIAIDFDPIRNQLKWTKDRARLAKDDCKTFWRIWEEEGWVSLGRTRDYDWMHVQAARL